jgi:hypothetical protein
MKLSRHTASRVRAHDPGCVTLRHRGTGVHSHGVPPPCPGARGRPTVRPGRAGGVDLVRRVVKRAGAEVHLSPKKYNLLAELVANAGKVLTHRHILMKVWGPAPRTRNISASSSVISATSSSPTRLGRNISSPSQRWEIGCTRALKAAAVAPSVKQRQGEMAQKRSSAQRHGREKVGNRRSLPSASIAANAVTSASLRPSPASVGPIGRSFAADASGQPGLARIPSAGFGAAVSTGRRRGDRRARKARNGPRLFVSGTRARLRRAVRGRPNRRQRSGRRSSSASAPPARLWQGARPWLILRGLCL